MKHANALVSGSNEGCPFYMPGDGHYRETIRDAVRYWNELARAIVALRETNARGVMVDAPTQINGKPWECAQCGKPILADLVWGETAGAFHAECRRAPPFAHGVLGTGEAQGEKQ
jgi:hypothetical protein